MCLFWNKNNAVNTLFCDFNWGYLLPRKSIELLFVQQVSPTGVPEAVVYIILSVDGSYNRSRSCVVERVAHEVTPLGFLFRYLINNVTIHKNVLSASLNETFPSMFVNFQLIKYVLMIPKLQI